MSSPRQLAPFALCRIVDRAPYSFDKLSLLRSTIGGGKTVPSWLDQTSINTNPFADSFGFHPDRDDSGTKISCEAHANSGGYHETSIKLPFNYRDAFHNYTIRHRHDGVSWWVDDRQVHELKDDITHPMKTSLILRTNRHGAMPTAIMEVAWFRFTPESTRRSDLN